MLRWSSNKSFLRLKIGRQKRSNAEHKFTNASWSTSVVVECSQASYVYLMGGCNFEKWSVSKRNVQVNTSSGFVVKMKDLPKRHLALKEKLIESFVAIIWIIIINNNVTFDFCFFILFYLLLFVWNDLTL